MTLAEFLLARIAEDEQMIGVAGCTCHHPTCPSRVLAECETKRRIVERETCADAPHCGDHDCMTIDEDRRILGTIYADHPDYRQEWRP